MGKVKGIFVGKICGSVGKVTFRCRSGENVVSQKIVQQTNPRTEAQQIQRMKMNTVVKAYSFLSPICDHSFEGFTSKQANMSRFVQNNIGMLDVTKSNGYPFNYFFAYRDGDVNYAPNEYYISEGSLRNPVSVQYINNDNVLVKNDKKIVVSKDITVQEFHNLFNVQIGTQFTVISVGGDTTDKAYLQKSRFVYSPANATSKMFSSNAQLDTSILHESSEVNESITLELVADGKAYNIASKYKDSSSGVAIILSKKENGKWKYSTERLCRCNVLAGIWDGFLAKWALPTYGIGANKYLNNATV